MIDACSAERNSHEALAVFDEMKTLGVHPNQYTFASLLNCCARARDVNGARDVLTLVLQSDMEYDLGLLVGMLQACVVLNDVSRIVQIANLAEKAGYDVENTLHRLALSQDRSLQEVELIMTVLDTLDIKTRPKLGAIVAGAREP